MRYLNKLTFINSASIPYGELQVAGNVHLIGTQGVGKSTLLRALLFFYNADTLRLGISREKKSFAEYYFPYQNSYIVYEVVRETGAYCVIAFKSSGKVCFRFFDAAYNKDFFISSTGQAFERWDDTRRLLDAHSIAYSPKIDRYEEYRDIIYGNSDTVRKELGRYAILQSRQYQNIPRTIQNVFLNSKLEAEFIKHTIITSLNEEELRIDLQHYSHHLKNFEEELSDIRQFRLPAVQKLAGSVIAGHSRLRHSEEERVRLAGGLAWAAAALEPQTRLWREKVEKSLAAKVELQQRMTHSLARHRGKAERIRGDITVLTNDIKRAKEAEAKYARLDIGQLLQRWERRGEHAAHVKRLSEELALLTHKWGTVEAKYNALLAAHDGALTGSLQGLESEGLRLQKEAMEVERAARNELREELQTLRKAASAEVQLAAAEADETQRGVMEERLRRERLLHTRFREEELAAIEAGIAQLSHGIREGTQRATHLKAEAENLRRQRELDEAHAQTGYAHQEERLQREEAAAAEALARLNAQLERSDGALYGWLSRQRPGWELNVGKIADESILFHTALSPVLAGDATPLSGDAASLYGIHLDLAALPVRVKTLAEYKAEQEEKAAAFAAYKVERAALQSHLATALEKIKKEAAPRLRKCRDEEATLRYAVEGDEARLKAERLRLKDTALAAADEKREALQRCDAAIAHATDEWEAAKAAAEKVASEGAKRIETREREGERRLKALQGETGEALRRIESRMAETKAAAHQKRGEIKEARKREMASNGADTAQLERLEGERKTAEDELLFLENHRDTIAEYRKDKRELIDKAPAFRIDVAALEQQYRSEENRYEAQAEKYRIEEHQLNEAAAVAAGGLRQAEEDGAAFAQFSLGQLWTALDASQKSVQEAYKTDRRAKAIIEDLNRCHGALQAHWDDLREGVNRFRGSFSLGDTLKFGPLPATAAEYRQFAQQLDEFVTENKIAEIEKRVDERFATIIHSIGRETEALMGKSAEISKVIGDINRDFESKNFVTAIQKIELRIDESANKVVKILLAIKKYNDEHAYELGALNLFNVVDGEAKNRKAVDLLKSFSKAIAEGKSEAIALSDTFELRFRVEENGNDSGWVEKLSNVGSEGTDVLVKAMINIMLLNVFKEGASRRFKDFRLHCMMDEIGKLHPVNVKGILQFANDRNINLVNGSPTENNALDYKHIYRLERDNKRHTRIKRIVTNLAYS